MRRLLIAALALAALASPINTAGLHAQVRNAAGGVTFNFQDADLSYVISMLAQAAGLRYVYSDMPAKNVTVRTSDPVPTADVVNLIKSLAEANGVSVVEQNGFLTLRGTPVQQGVQQDLRQLYVLRLKHARAPVLASTLQQLFGGSGSSTGRQSTAQSLSQQIQSLQQQGGRAGNQITIPNMTFQVGGAAGAAPTIVPDELTNSLLIRAMPNDWAVIQQAIQTLDLRPLQVVIEVIIAEVQHSNNLNLGTTISGTKNDTELGDVTGSVKGADTTSAFTLSILRQGNIDIQATLSAFAAKGNVRILSRPVIVAQNNTEAIINVGTEVPFVQASQSLAGNNGGTFNQVVQYRDVGTILTILPTINPDGYVNMEVQQTVSNQTNETLFNAPIINTREATTMILARDGQTVAIGGLVDKQTTKRRAGIPILKDIPLIGWLFGTETSSDVNNELFLFLTPHVVMTDADADRMKNELEKASEQLGPLRPIAPLIPPKQDTLPRGRVIPDSIRPDTIR